MPADGTHLQPNLSFKGQMEISGEESFVIHGAFEGLIIAKTGKVFVGETGVFRGSIEAAEVAVAGTIEPLTDNDSITATKTLVITETGQVASPSIAYGKIAMELGAVLHGQIKPSHPRPARAADPLPNSERPQPAAATGSRVFSIDARNTAPLPAFLKPATPAVAVETETGTEPQHAAMSHGSDDSDLGGEAPYARTGTHDADALTPIGE